MSGKIGVRHAVSRRFEAAISSPFNVAKRWAPYGSILAPEECRSRPVLRFATYTPAQCLLNVLIPMEIYCPFNLQPAGFIDGCTDQTGSPDSPAQDRGRAQSRGAEPGEAYLSATLWELAVKCSSHMRVALCGRCHIFYKALSPPANSFQFDEASSFAGAFRRRNWDR
jgi:hypothetical protein